MAKKFKDQYERGCARLIADKLKRVHPAFTVRQFVSELQLRPPRSVGNNLNDLLKEDREKALKLITEWRAGRTLALLSEPQDLMPGSLMLPLPACPGSRTSVQADGASPGTPSVKERPWPPQAQKT